MIPDQESLLPLSQATPKQPAEIIIEDHMKQKAGTPLPVTPQIHDVVQVNNPNSEHFGVLFQIGDINEGKLHGFIMHTGGRKEFVTVGVGEVIVVGIARMRSKQPVSEQWAAMRNAEKAKQ
jgi:hypothetical protein